MPLVIDRMRKRKGRKRGRGTEGEGRLTQRNVIIQDIRNMRENDLECLEVWHDFKARVVFHKLDACQPTILVDKI